MFIFELLRNNTKMDQAKEEENFKQLQQNKAFKRRDAPSSSRRSQLPFASKILPLFILFTNEGWGRGLWLVKNV